MKILYLALFLIATSAFGQVGETGNGGGGEPGFHMISIQITDWLNRNQQRKTLGAKLHLLGGSVTPALLTQAYLNALKTAQVKFIPQNKLAEEFKRGDKVAGILLNTSRICWNHVRPDIIECNEDRFNASSGDLQFTINFHEYLGIAGIETSLNTSDEVAGKNSYSQYPISKYLMQYVRPSRVERYELGDEVAVKAPNHNDGDIYSLGGDDTPSYLLISHARFQTRKEAELFCKRHKVHGHKLALDDGNALMFFMMLPGPEKVYFSFMSEGEAQSGAGEWGEPTENGTQMVNVFLSGRGTTVESYSLKQVGVKSLPAICSSDTYDTQNAPASPQEERKRVNKVPVLLPQLKGMTPEHWNNKTVLPDGTIWSDTLPMIADLLKMGVQLFENQYIFFQPYTEAGLYTFYEAGSLCSALGGRVPEEKDFKALPKRVLTRWLESDKIRNPIKSYLSRSDSDQVWFWTSTEGQMYEEDWNTFREDDGAQGGSDGNTGNLVRCIFRPAQLRR